MRNAAHHGHRFLRPAAVVLVCGVFVFYPPTPPGSGPRQAGAATGQSDGDHGFTVSGNVENQLSPGATEPVGLILTNSNNTPLTVTNLTVEIKEVTARDGGAADCGTDQFVVQQFSGKYGFRLGANHVSNLAGLGLRPTHWPQVTMPNLKTNQDGCKNVLIHFRVTGTALELTS